MNGCGLAATDAASFRRRTPALEGDAYLLAPETRYFITDHLGSTRVVLKGDGTLSMKADYLPYGRIIGRSGPNVADNDYLCMNLNMLINLKLVPLVLVLIKKEFLFMIKQMKWKHI